MLLQFYSMLTLPSSLTLEVSVMSFELCVHDGQGPVRRAMLSGDSSCSIRRTSDYKTLRDMAR